MPPLAADSLLTGGSDPTLRPVARDGAVRFTFADESLLEEAQRTLELARIAVESLYGFAVVALDVDYRADLPARSVVIDVTSGVGRTLAAVYHGYVIAEFGSNAVTIERVRAPQARSARAEVLP